MFRTIYPMVNERASDNLEGHQSEWHGITVIGHA